MHRPFHLAIVDEADSLLIDEARVPLVIAGGFDGEASRATRAAGVVAALVPGVHFDTDEYVIRADAQPVPRLPKPSPNSLFSDKAAGGTLIMSAKSINAS